MDIKTLEVRDPYAPEPPPEANPWAYGDEVFQLSTAVVASLSAVAGAVLRPETPHLVFDVAYIMGPFVFVYAVAILVALIHDWLASKKESALDEVDSIHMIEVPDSTAGVRMGKIRDHIVSLPEDRRGDLRRLWQEARLANEILLQTPGDSQARTRIADIAVAVGDYVEAAAALAAGPAKALEASKESERRMAAESLRAQMDPRALDDVRVATDTMREHL